MADSPIPPPQTSAAAVTGLTVPPEVLQKFSQLIELIRGSESMNDEERQYWVNILPIMTPEQIKNLFDILENERKQLAAIDAKYRTDADKIGQAATVRQTEEDMKKRRTERSAKEASHKEGEEKAAEDLLKQMEEAGK